MTDEQTFERSVAESVQAVGPVAPTDGAHDLTLSRISRSRQDPEWLALIKESPMRSNSRVTVGSPTVRVMAIMVATMLAALALAAAGAGAQRLLAADKSVVVVAQDGSGDVTTITEALDLAEQGRGIEEVLIRPGTYVEALFTDRDITIRGDGDREDIVVMAPEDGPESETYFPWLGEQPYAIVLEAIEGGVENLTLRGTDSRLFVNDGAPVIKDVVFDGVGDAVVSGSARAQAVIVTTGSRASILDNEFRGAGGVNVFESAAPNIEGNLFDDGTIIYGDFGSGAMIRDNDFRGSGAFGIRLGEPADILIEANHISGRDVGIDEINGLGAASVVANTISGTTMAAISAGDSTGRIVENVIEDGAIGISWSGDGGLIADNSVSGGATGIVVGAGTSTVEGNSVEGADNRGMLIYATAVTELSGNTLCGNGIDLDISEGADVTDDGTNEICEDATA